MELSTARGCGCAVGLLWWAQPFGNGTDAAEDSTVKSDVDLFSGSWSSWLNQQSQISMGAHLLPSAITSKPPTQDENCKEAHVFPKTVIMLPKEEIDEIISSELNFTSSKIQDNFSNGFAFHY